jgi:hypothetical protein
VAGGGGLIRKSRKHASGHDFGLGLACEKESEEGNAFRGLEQGAGGRGRWTTARRSMMATASKRRGGRGRGKGKAGRGGPLRKTELQWWFTATEERRGDDGDSGRGAAAKAAVRARVCEVRRQRLYRAAEGASTSGPETSRGRRTCCSQTQARV